MDEPEPPKDMTFPSRLTWANMLVCPSLVGKTGTYKFAPPKAPTGYHVPAPETKKGDTWADLYRTHRWEYLRENAPSYQSFFAPFES